MGAQAEATMAPSRRLTGKLTEAMRLSSSGEDSLVGFGLIV
jgi:hypothetical protein